VYVPRARDHNHDERGLRDILSRIRRYTEFAMVLHWLVAAGIAFLYVHGFDMMRIEESQRLPQLNLHRSVGVTVFALVLVRIWWRMVAPAAGDSDARRCRRGSPTSSTS
jgi:cytochrome b561